MNSIIAWIGGKSLLTPQIIRRLPAHTCYCEVFAGASWVLFRKTESPVEVINDINSDLVNLYRAIKLHLEEFIRYFKWLLVSREEFERFKLERPETLTDIQRAVRFYYLLKAGFAGRIVNPSFGTSSKQRPRLNLLRIEEELSEAHLRLSRVTIENLPYDQLLRRYDRPEVFFYLDPPYHGFEDYYGKGVFGRDDFGRLRDILGAIEGKFLVSINDVPEIRRLFKGFKTETVRTSYTAAGGDKAKKVSELLIRNY